MKKSLLVYYLVCISCAFSLAQNKNHVSVKLGINYNNTIGNKLPSDIISTKNSAVLKNEPVMIKPARYFRSPYLAAGFNSFSKKWFGIYIGMAYSQTRYQVSYYEHNPEGIKYHGWYSSLEGNFVLCDHNIRIEFDFLFKLKDILFKVSIFNPEYTIPEAKNESMERVQYRQTETGARGPEIKRNKVHLENNTFSNHFFSSTTVGVDYNLKIKENIFPIGIVGFHSLRGAYYGIRCYIGYSLPVKQKPRHDG